MDAGGIPSFLGQHVPGAGPRGISGPSPAAPPLAPPLVAGGLFIPGSFAFSFAVLVAYLPTMLSWARGKKRAEDAAGSSASGMEGVDEGEDEEAEVSVAGKEEAPGGVGGPEDGEGAGVTVVATGGDPSGAVARDIAPLAHLKKPGDQGAADRREKKPLWLKAWTDPLAGVDALSTCTCISDLSGDGEGLYAVANANQKLLIYKGTGLLSELKLLAQPACMSYFYVQAGKAPALAVGAGGQVYIYRNLRPYYRFAVAPLPLDAVEKDAWEQYANGQADAASTASVLSQARDSGTYLTSRSMDFLSFDDDAKRDEYGKRACATRLEPSVSVACMCNLRIAMDEPDAASCLVIGTEDGRIMLLNTAGTKVERTIVLPAPASKVVATGLRDIEYRIVVATRNGKIYSIKNGELTSTVIELESMAVALLRPVKSILVGCMNNSLLCYHLKGRKTYSLYMPAPIVAMEYLASASTNTRGTIVALRTGEIRLYNEKHLVGKVDIEEVPMSLSFGRYGREDNTLIASGESGTVHIYVLARLAKLHLQAEGAGPPPEQDIPLPVPKKTRLYVEQTQREREQCIDMHRVFQRDLCKLRLNTARAYAKILSDGHGPVSTTASANIRVQCSVMGLGPLFKLKLSVQNTGSSVVTQVPLVTSGDAKLYDVQPVQMTLPALVPLLTYTYEVTVQAMDPTQPPGVITVYVLSGKESSLPLLCLQVNMPQSDMSSDM